MSMELLEDFKKWLGRKRGDDQQKVKFVSTIEGLDAWCPIVPAKKFVPQWFKEQPTLEEDDFPSTIGQRIKNGELPSGCPIQFQTRSNRTIKKCPGLQDVLTSGYILPFWGAAVAEVDREGKNVFFQTSTYASGYGNLSDPEMTGVQKDGMGGADFVKLQMAREEEIKEYLNQTLRGEESADIKQLMKLSSEHDQFTQFSVHHSNQYKRMLQEFPDQWADPVCKLHNVWRFYTPPGYSIMVTNPDYHFNPLPIRTLYGLLDTDNYHVMNLFFWVMQKACQFEIPYGTPMAHINVYKRTDLPYEVRSATPEELRENRIIYNFTTSKWGSAKNYRQIPKMKENLKKSKNGENNTEIL
jgi:hypothetical protein